MEGSSIVSTKEIWIIRRGGEIKNRIPEATEMAAEIRSGVYRALLCEGGGGGLSSMVMGGRCKSGLPKSYLKVLLKHS